MTAGPPQPPRDEMCRHEIWGIREIASAAGVSTGAVHNWRVRELRNTKHRKAFPLPKVILAMGPIWDARPVREWIGWWREQTAQRRDYDALERVRREQITPIEEEGTDAR